MMQIEMRHYLIREKGGFPSCDQWWDESGAGLKSRLLTDMRQNLSAQVSDFFNSIDNQDEALLRTLLRSENIDVSKGKCIKVTVVAWMLDFGMRLLDSPQL